MKTLIMALLMLCPLVSKAADQDFVKTGGGDINVIGTLGNEDLTYNRNYYLTPAHYGMGKVSTAITYTPKTYSSVTFSTASYTIGSASITITAHGLTTGLEVLLATGALAQQAPLVLGTTYFAISFTADVIQLAATSAQAFAADPIVMLAKSGTGAQTYTLSALAATGTPGFVYSASNDGTNFFALSVSSTLANPLGNANTWQYDFSEFNYSTLKLAVTAPTVGALTIRGSVNLKP